MKAPAPTDDQLVQAALQGSADAYRFLVERYQRPVLSVVARMVRDPGLAEDLTQEAFARAFQSLRSFDPDRSFSSWLFKIAHNRAIDHLRRKRRPMVPLEASDASGQDSWEVIEAPEHQSPLRQAESAELSEVIDRALTELRPNYRQVLILRFQAGLSYQEIADTMEISMASVKVLLHRARKQLATVLTAEGLAPNSDSMP